MQPNSYAATGSSPWMLEATTVWSSPILVQTPPNVVSSNLKTMLVFLFHSFGLCCYLISIDGAYEDMEEEQCSIPRYPKPHTQWGGLDRLRQIESRQPHRISCKSRGEMICLWRISGWLGLDFKNSPWPPQALLALPKNLFS